MKEDGATIQPKSFWLGRVCHLVYVMVAIPWKSLLPNSKHLSDAGWAERPYSFCPSRTPALHLLYQRAVRQKFSKPGISVLGEQNTIDSGDMLSKDRCKTTAGFIVIPLLSQLWDEKNYCERRNELSSWRPVALPNRHIHLFLFKLGYDVHALLSSVMYILSGENITALFTISRRRWDQNTTQVANRLDRARATYVWLLHLTPWFHLGLKTRAFMINCRSDTAELLILRLN